MDSLGQRVFLHVSAPASHGSGTRLRDWRLPSKCGSWCRCGNSSASRLAWTRELAPFLGVLVSCSRSSANARLPGFPDPHSPEFGRGPLLLANLPEHLADAARFAYFIGWRKGEIVSLRWEAVDRQAREVRLRTSKNGRGRVLPLDGELWSIIEGRWQARQVPRPDGSAFLSEFVSKGREDAWAISAKRGRPPAVSGCAGQVLP